MRAQDLIENDDHDRTKRDGGCPARAAPCTCGHEARVYSAAKADAAEITRLRAAGQAVVDSHPMTPSYQIAALRTALKEGGGE